MPRFAWVTDPHLNFVPFRRWEVWIREILAAQVEGVLISGDISESEDVVFQLQRLAEAVEMRVWFVLGNHDFYRSSIAQVRRDVQEASADHPQLHYLTGSAGVQIAEDWYLTGEDGWADGRIGDYYGSPVRLNDYHLIEELTGVSAKRLLRVIRREAVAGAVRLCRQLDLGRQQAKNQIVLTHLPPFREACWYEGRFGDDDWAPFFTCSAIGWLLKRFCRRHPEQQVWVLCGHTHGGGKSRIAPNLTVWTGAAEYGEPRVTEVVQPSLFPAAAVDWSFDVAGNYGRAD